MDRTWRASIDVTWMDRVGPAKSLDEVLQALLRDCFLRIEVADGAFEVQACKDGRRTVAWTGDEEEPALQRVIAPLFHPLGLVPTDQRTNVRVGEDEAWTGAKVTQQTRLEVALGIELLMQQDVAAQIDLSCCEIVCGFLKRAE